VITDPAETIVASAAGRPVAVVANPPGAARRVRLVFLIRNLDIGGAERQLVTLATGLDPEVFDVTVLSFYEAGTFARELRSAGVRLITIQKKRRWEVFGFLLRLTRALRMLRPEIIHPYMTGQNVLGIIAKAVVPSARIVFGVRASNMEAGPRDRLERLLSRLEMMFVRFADLIIFNSRAGRANAAPNLSRARWVVIPNGVDVSRFAPNCRTGSALRASWKIPEGAHVIGLVARLNPMKDHPTFLRAAAILARSKAGARFVCVGDGPRDYMRSLKQFSESLGLARKVIWTGALYDMPAAYSAFDISCSSSAYGEGTSNSIAEAMACCVPCVVTDVGDSRRVIGETGIVVPPRNPQALATALSDMSRRIEQNPRLGESARLRIATHMDVSTMVRKTSVALLGLL
jgi:glycosyltransferase involved in cell wall biosynthesis